MSRPKSSLLRRRRPASTAPVQPARHRQNRRDPFSNRSQTRAQTQRETELPTVVLPPLIRVILQHCLMFAERRASSRVQNPLSFRLRRRWGPPAPSKAQNRVNTRRPARKSRSLTRTLGGAVFLESETPNPTLGAPSAFAGSAQSTRPNTRLSAAQREGVEWALSRPVPDGGFSDMSIDTANGPESTREGGVESGLSGLSRVSRQLQALQLASYTMQQSTGFTVSRLMMCITFLTNAPLSQIRG